MVGCYHVRDVLNKICIIIEIFMRLKIYSEVQDINCCEIFFLSFRINKNELQKLYEYDNWIDSIEKLSKLNE